MPKGKEHEEVNNPDILLNFAEEVLPAELPESLPDQADVG